MKQLLRGMAVYIGKSHGLPHASHDKLAKMAFQIEII